MKLKRTFLAYALLTGAALSCTDDDSHGPSVKDLSPYAQQFVTMRLSSSNAMRESSDAAINSSFQGMMQGMRAFAGGRVKADSVSNDGGGSDTTIYNDPWVSCAVITTVNNPDGSITTTYDYGDGCDEGWGEYKYLMHGKYVQTYKYEMERSGSVYTYTYLFKTFFENYGGQYQYDTITSAWTNDGNTYYTGSSTYDTASQKFSGSYTSYDTAVYRYNGIVNQYKSKGKAKYSEMGSTQEESEYEYGDGNNYYHSKVIQPLVSDYTCNDNGFNTFREFYVWIPVSGREVITYKQDGKEGSFEIEYGDGECDNILYIIEDGKRVRVDMGDFIPWCGTWMEAEG